MMQREHTIAGTVPGTCHLLHSYHYGSADAAGPHAYLQAGLHADELPGVLLLHRLRQHLAQLEAAGQLRGRVTLVPMANPIGLGQHLQGQHLGRFHSGSGENFNRHYPDVSAAAATLLAAGELTPRAALCRALAAQPAGSGVAQLRRLLFGLALEAELVLDIHCDSEAVLHLYGNRRHAAALAELAGYTQAGATLLCDEAGGMSFDDAIVQNWRRLESRLGCSLDIPLAATLELRGACDVADSLAARDEAALLAWLVARGVLLGTAVPAPQPPQPATPLAGVECVVAPHGGVVVYQRPLGQWLPAGSRLGYVLDPLSGERSALSNQHAGYYYARAAGRLALAGGEIAYLATAEERRDGMLLSA